MYLLSGTDVPGGYAACVSHAVQANSVDLVRFSRSWPQGLPEAELCPPGSLDEVFCRAEWREYQGKRRREQDAYRQQAQARIQACNPDIRVVPDFSKESGTTLIPGWAWWVAGGGLLLGVSAWIRSRS